MHDPALPQSVVTEFRDLKRRLDNLERSPQLLSASIKGGTLRVLDSNGVEIAAIGEYTAGYNGIRISDTSGQEIFVAGEFAGSFGDHVGMRVQDSTGADLAFFSDSSGQAIPRDMGPWRKGPTADLVTTTSATYVKVWESQVPVIQSTAVRTTLVVLVNVADVARVKFVAPSISTDEVTLDGSVATQWAVTLNWLHGKTIGTGPVVFECQAKRHTGSAAAITIFEPDSGLQQLGGVIHAATSGGLTAA